MYRNEDKFRKLVNLFRNKGYNVTVDELYGYLYAYNDIANEDIRFGFCTNCDGVINTINGRVAADNGRSFLGWGGCILSLKYPNNNNQFEILCGHIKFLSTLAGREYSKDQIRKITKYTDTFPNDIIRNKMKKDYGLI